MIAIEANPAGTGKGRPSAAGGGPLDDRLVVSADAASGARFCFLGEFGYELISWIPYLLYLKKTLQIRLRTVSRVGSSAVYYFSDDHREVEPALIGGCWGDMSSYAALRERFGDDLLIHPGEHRNCVNRRHIEIGGCEWTTRDIHRRIESSNYTLPDFSFLAPWNPIPDRPLIVINNKHYVQWPDRFDQPVNSFDPDALRSLRDLLTSKGYGVVYNHFVESTSIDETLELADRGIFGGDTATFDMRSMDQSRTAAGQRNLTQLSLYRAATLVIGPQGGNLYLPAMCRRPVIMLMRCGDYVDYLELGRLYGVEVEAFYEPRHLLEWLRARLPQARPAGGDATSQRGTP